MRLFKVYYRDKEPKTFALTSKRKLTKEDRKGMIYTEDITDTMQRVFDELPMLMQNEGFTRDELMFTMACLTK